MRRGAESHGSPQLTRLRKTIKLTDAPAELPGEITEVEDFVDGADELGENKARGNIGAAHDTTSEDDGRHLVQEKKTNDKLASGTVELKAESQKVGMFGERNGLSLAERYL